MDLKKKRNNEIEKIIFDRKDQEKGESSKDLKS